MIKEVKTGAYTRNGETFEFKFYDNLTTKEKLGFIDSITKTLVGENYNFLLRDMLFDYNLIVFLAEIDLSEIKDNPDAIGFIEVLLEETNIVDIIKANIRSGLIEELNCALDINLEYRTGVKVNSLEKAFASLLSAIEKKVGAINTEEMMEVAMNLNNLVGKIDSNQIVEAYINQTLKDK